MKIPVHYIVDRIVIYIPVNDVRVSIRSRILADCKPNLDCTPCISLLVLHGFSFYFLHHTDTKISENNKCNIKMCKLEWNLLWWKDNYDNFAHTKFIKCTIRKVNFDNSLILFFPYCFFYICENLLWLLVIVVYQHINV